MLDANMSADITAKHGDTVLINNQSLFTLKILGGPGTGQTRLVTGWDHVRAQWLLLLLLPSWYFDLFLSFLFP